MKKFLISEEEKNRILNLHENMKIVDKERQLELFGKQLNENVGQVIFNLVKRSVPALKTSTRLLSNLDSFARSGLKGVYTPPITNGTKLLDAFVAGKLRNLTNDDDAVKTLQIIFSKTDDDQLIKDLAAEMVDGSVDFKNGLLNGTIDPMMYGPKQGRAIQDYISSLRQQPFNPGGGYSPGRGFGNFDDYLPGYGNVKLVDPDYVEQMLRQMFQVEPRAIKWIDDNIKSLNFSVPLNQAQADRIISKNEALIDKMLQQQGIPKNQWKEFKAYIKKNWAFKKVSSFYLTLAVLGVFLTINKLFGINALTPLKLAADALGLTEGYQAVLSYMCDNQVPWACDAKSGGGGSSSGGDGGGGALDK